MTELPRKWCCSGRSDLPPFPPDLYGKVWVKSFARELHAVCALDLDEDWAELIACDSDGSKLISHDPVTGIDVVRVRIYGDITQGLR
jgi:hypothetical protein